MSYRRHPVRHQILGGKICVDEHEDRTGATAVCIGVTGSRWASGRPGSIPVTNSPIRSPRSNGLALTHRLMQLPAVSRRAERLVGPRRCLLIDG